MALAALRVRGQRDGVQQREGRRLLACCAPPSRSRTTAALGRRVVVPDHQRMRLADAATRRRHALRLQR
jgi:hypothetical protein